MGAKSCQMPECAHHRVLKDILCVFKVANDPHILRFSDGL